MSREAINIENVPNTYDKTGLSNRICNKTLLGGFHRKEYSGKLGQKITGTNGYIRGAINKFPDFFGTGI